MFVEFSGKNLNYWPLDNTRISMKTLSLEFHEYCRIPKRPILSSCFKIIQDVGIRWIFKNIQAHKKLEISRHPKLFFLQVLLTKARHKLHFTLIYLPKKLNI